MQTRSGSVEGGAPATLGEGWDTSRSREIPPNSSFLQPSRALPASQELSPPCLGC